MDTSTKVAESQELGSKVASLLRKRLDSAARDHAVRVRAAHERYAKACESARARMNLQQSWTEPYHYAIDFMQRSILFWDALRQRGNDYVEGANQGSKPVLKFQYETIADARKFAKPVNYALVSIVPPAGVQIDPKQRPYIIIDPRAGHGPGIAGFKDDSEVGVALAAGHPVYFVMFFQHPEPGQTLLDVCEAEKEFVRIVRERHPDSPKPVILGNCQGGWAAAMLAAADPDEMGPVILIGSPMSYWGGAWHEEQAPNPMRYAGGLLGGTWLSSCAADLGNGLFDGAYLVENFEYLEPCEYVLGQVLPGLRKCGYRTGAFRGIRAVVVQLLPHEPRGDRVDYAQPFRRQQAVVRRREAGETARRSICGTSSRRSSCSLPSATTSRHLSRHSTGSPTSIARPRRSRPAATSSSASCMKTQATSASSSPARSTQKETRKLVEVMEAIELLQPGIYGMEITENADASGKPAYDVSFREYRLEDIVAKLNPLQRQDERPFEAVQTVSEFNQRAYELFAASFREGDRKRIGRRSCCVTCTRCEHATGRCRMRRTRGSRGSGRPRRRSRRSVSTLRQTGLCARSKR